jgi:ClpP class serine protease
MVSPFTEEESLPPAQAQNEADLFGELNRSMCHMIGVGRWSKLDAEAAEKKVVDLAKNGPYSAREALEAGLIDGVKYKRELIESLFSKDEEGKDESGIVKSDKAPRYGELRLDSPNAPKFKVSPGREKPM